MGSMIKKALLGLSLSVGLSAAHADIIDLGNQTHDTSSGLVWLDLTETIGQSYLDVSSELGAGGLYEGYRYANTSEVKDFYLNYAATGGNVAGFVDLVGQTLEWAVPASEWYEWLSIGYVGDDTNDPYGGVAWTYANYWYDEGVYGEWAPSGELDDFTTVDDRLDYVGSFLVMSPVPAPAALPMALLGLGLIGVAYRKRKLAAKARV